MTELRPLRGGCQCGRNRYIIAVPEDGLDEAQVLFNTEPEHRTYPQEAYSGGTLAPPRSLLRAHEA